MCLFDATDPSAEWAIGDQLLVEFVGALSHDHPIGLPLTRPLQREPHHQAVVTPYIQSYQLDETPIIVVLQGFIWAFLGQIKPCKLNHFFLPFRSCEDWIVSMPISRNMLHYVYQKKKHLLRNSVVHRRGAHGECILNPDTRVAHQPRGQISQRWFIKPVTKTIVYLVRPHAEVRILNGKKENCTS